MIRSVKNENGLTFIELLAVIIISGFIMMMATSLIVQGMKNQQKITAETQLRDEADLIMSKLLKEIFTLKESEIARVECGTVMKNASPIFVSCQTESDTLSALQLAEMTAAKQALETCAATAECSTFAWIVLKTDEKIGFFNDAVVINDKMPAYMPEFETNIYKIENDNLSLNPYYTVEENSQSTEPFGERFYPTSITISFRLMNSEKKMSQLFQNKIITVND